MALIYPPDSEAARAPTCRGSLVHTLISTIRHVLRLATATISTSITYEIARRDVEVSA